MPPANPTRDSHAKAKPDHYAQPVRPSVPVGGLIYWIAHAFFLLAFDLPLLGPKMACRVRQLFPAASATSSLW